MNKRQAFEVAGIDGFNTVLTAGSDPTMDMTGPVPVRTGFYEIWETIPEGWMDVSVNCNTAFTVEEESDPTMVHIEFDVDKNEAVECSFENMRNEGSIKICIIYTSDDADE